MARRIDMLQEGSNSQSRASSKRNSSFPGLVLWYHGEALVPRDSKRIKVTTKVTNITISHLNISGAKSADSGNYSCWPSSGKQDTVRVHVIQ
ncbi:UNVERIFIED_CONTAM: hypothetical protein GTU68_047790, partial [Idotea baltica]|nr:hypothetical protein [Idotea baltica]